MKKKAAKVRRTFSRTDPVSVLGRKIELNAGALVLALFKATGGINWKPALAKPYQIAGLRIWAAATDLELHQFAYDIKTGRSLLSIGMEHQTIPAIIKNLHLRRRVDRQELKRQGLK